MLNCAARGLGLADIFHLACTGKTWYKVSPTVKFRLEGSLPFGVYGKDVFLAIAEKYGSQEGHDIEFEGPGLESMPLDDRATLSTMCTELNANFVMMPADRLVREHIASVTNAPFEAVESDPDAEYAAVHVLDLSELAPRIAMPNSMNRNVRSASAIGEERVKVDQAFIGSCCQRQTVRPAGRRRDRPRPTRRGRRAVHRDAGISSRSTSRRSVSATSRRSSSLARW